MLETSRSRARSVRKSDDPLEKVIADGRDFFFSTPFFISLDIATSINSKAFRQKLMGMVRKARLPAEQAWLEALMASGMSEKTADDVLWLTLGLVRGFAIRMLWQDEPERFDRLLKLWRGIVEGYVKESAVFSTSSIPLPARGRGREGGTRVRTPSPASPPSGGEEHEGEGRQKKKDQTRRTQPCRD